MSGIGCGTVINSSGVYLSRLGLVNKAALVFELTNTGGFLTVRLLLGTLGIELVRLRIFFFDTGGGGKL